MLKYFLLTTGKTIDFSFTKINVLRKVYTCLNVNSLFFLRIRLSTVSDAMHDIWHTLAATVKNFRYYVINHYSLGANSFL